MAQAELHELEQRPQRYWNVDGIPELVMGGLWLLWGGAFLIGEALPRGWVGVVYYLTVPLVLALSGFAGRRLVTRLKERVTYPRTGYVDYPASARRACVITGALAIAAAATLVVFAVSAERLAAPAVGVVLCLMFLVMSLRQRAPHLLALAAVALILGVAGGVVQLGWSSLNWLFVGMGLAAASVGGFRLCRYLKANPR
jgi:hypothetical protein